jgi:hypothetical protein
MLVSLYGVSVMKPEKIDCFKCRHFFVTWDKKFPRGCRALGFKSKDMPSQMVFQASGMQCLKFEKKETATRQAERKSP